MKPILPKSSAALTSLTSLPIDALMPEIREAFLAHSQVLVKASPGSGKTTRIPVALASAFPGAIYILQPRRIAARLAAERVASETGSELGEKVGYHFRFERKRSNATKILFFTEGLFLRELQANPELKGVSVVLLDEFHERHLSTDLAFGALLELQRDRRPDLKLGILSATLDADGLAEFLERFSPAKQKPKSIFQNLEKFPLTIEYLEPLPSSGGRHSAFEERVSRKVIRGLRKVLGNHSGAGESIVTRASTSAATSASASVPTSSTTSAPSFDLGTECLVFLPGMREIRDSEKEIALEFPEMQIVCLHSELTKEEQASALLPSPKRKVILATNIAESSVTFPRVRAVIDSGLVRMKVYRSGSGLERLITAKISQASAIQRAGRAGRVGPGRVMRLYSEKEFLEMKKIEIPEILRTDPAEFAFEVYRLEKNPETFPFLSAPTKQALGQAAKLFQSLGVISDGRLTKLGRRVRELSLSPRLSLLFLLSDLYGLREKLLPLVVKLQEGEDLPLDASEAFSVNDFSGMSSKRSFEQLRKEPIFQAERQGGVISNAPKIESLSAEMLLLKVFPERLARIAGPKCFMATGRTFHLEEKLRAETHTFFPMKGSELLSLILDAEEKEGTLELKIFSKIDLERPEVEEVFFDLIEWKKSARFCEETKRVLLSEEERWGELVLEKWEKPGAWEELGSEEKESLRAGIRSFYFREGSELRKELVNLGEKLRLHQSFSAEFKEISLERLEHQLIEWLMESFESLRRESQEEILKGLQNYYSTSDLFSKLMNDFPEFISLPRRKKVPVHYEAGKNPWMESRLQDFLGLKVGPMLLAGKLPITLHLNAPNGRAMQVTEDLERFWKVHYPEVRKELLRRYPRHQWPEDPTKLYLEEE